MQIGIGQKQIFLFSTGHSQSKFKHLFVLFFSFELFNFLGCLGIGFEHHGSAIFEIVQLNLHVCRYQ